MGKPKSNGIERETISEIFQYFGMQDDSTKRAWKKAAGIESSEIKAAVSDCLPSKSRWKKIKTAAETHGWKPAEVHAS